MTPAFPSTPAAAWPPASRELVSRPCPGAPTSPPRETEPAFGQPAPVGLFPAGQRPGLQTGSRRHRLHVPTCRARAQSLAGVELLRHLAQVQQKIAVSPRQLVQLPVTPLAIPGIALRLMRPPDPLHD